MTTHIPLCFSSVTNQEDLIEYDHILIVFHNTSFHWQPLITYPEKSSCYIFSVIFSKL